MCVLWLCVSAICLCVSVLCVCQCYSCVCVSAVCVCVSAIVCVSVIFVSLYKQFTRISQIFICYMHKSTTQCFTPRWDRAISYVSCHKYHPVTVSLLQAAGAERDQESPEQSAASAPEPGPQQGAGALPVGELSGGHHPGDHHWLHQAQAAPHCPQ